MRKRAKLALVLILVAVGGLIAFAGAKPQAMRNVSDLAAAPDAFAEKPVQVKAVVREGSVDRSDGALRFLIEDDRARVLVEWASAKPIPDHDAGGTLDGRNVVLTGTMAAREDGVWVFRATEMQVGCASKVEPE